MGLCVSFVYVRFSHIICPSCPGSLLSVLPAPLPPPLTNMRIPFPTRHSEWRDKSKADVKYNNSVNTFAEIVFLQNNTYIYIYLFLIENEWTYKDREESKAKTYWQLLLQVCLWVAVKTEVWKQWGTMSLLNPIHDLAQSCRTKALPTS